MFYKMFRLGYMRWFPGEGGFVAPFMVTELKAFINGTSAHKRYY